MKEDYDGAEPTASSVSVMNLLTLTHLINDDLKIVATWSNEIVRTLRHFGTRLEQIGRAVPLMAAALATYLAGLRQVVIVGDANHELLEPLRTSYHPFAISLNVSSADQSALAARLPFIAAMRAVDGRPAAYVCRDFTCQAPVTDVAALEKALA
jgi:uncharacterized protein YyaL (SSP411 family)